MTSRAAVNRRSWAGRRHHLQTSPSEMAPRALLDAPGAGNPEGKPGQPTLPPPVVAGADFFREPGRTAAMRSTADAQGAFPQ